jgi:preprotein translocase subunit SecG
MGTIISILIVIVCLLLCAVVLVQNSKGGGLASDFSSSNQVMGVRKTGDFLEKATWSLAIALLALSLVSTSVNKAENASNGAKKSETSKKANELAPVLVPTGGGIQGLDIPQVPNP